MSNAAEIGKSFHPLKESPEALNYPVPYEHSAVSRQCPEPTPLSVDNDDPDASLFHECPAIPRLDSKSFTPESLKILSGRDGDHPNKAWVYRLRLAGVSRILKIVGHLHLDLSICFR